MIQKPLRRQRKTLRGQQRRRRPGKRPSLQELMQRRISRLR